LIKQKQKNNTGHPSLNASPQNAYPLLMHSIFRDGHRLLVINAFIEEQLYNWDDCILTY
jgi:hypothetical protein